MKDESRAKKTAVVVGTITNDVRLFDMPKMTVSDQYLTFRVRGLLGKNIVKTKNILK